MRGVVARLLAPSTVDRPISAMALAGQYSFDRKQITQTMEDIAATSARMYHRDAHLMIRQHCDDVLR
eukprot:6675571-Pyramimonas_sp.AAC.1